LAQLAVRLLDVFGEILLPFPNYGLRKRLFRKFVGVTAISQELWLNDLAALAEGLSPADTEAVGNREFLVPLAWISHPLGKYATNCFSYPIDAGCPRPANSWGEIRVSPSSDEEMKPSLRHAACP
jgi:hypothetical protein